MALYDSRMGDTSLNGRYAEKIKGQLGCFDRVVLTGTLTEVAYPKAMEAVLWQEDIRCFDMGVFADQMRERVRDNAISQAREAGVEIEYLAKSKGVRKEHLIAKELARRGNHSGLVHVLGVMEDCTRFKPWHDKSTGQAFNTQREESGEENVHFSSVIVH